MASYLPLTDSGLLGWSENFNTQLNSIDPTLIGLTTDDVTAYGLLFSAYDTAYTNATNPSTRGGATIQAKKDAKAPLITESRRLAMIVTNHPGTTDAQRQAMGLTIRDTTPTPVPVPETAPLISVTAVAGHRISLRLKNAEEVTSRAKPEGVKGATLFSYVGDSTPADLSDWKFEGNVTRTLVNLDIAPTVPGGDKVWVTAFWFNTRGQSGPATTPVYTRVGVGLGQNDQPMAA